MNIPIFKRDLVHTLYQNIETNLPLYQQHDFSPLFQEKEYCSQIRELDGLTFNKTNLSSLAVIEEGPKDIENAITVYKELGALTPSLAADGRIWVALCHLVCTKFVWERWVGKDTQENQIKKIKEHFFATGSDRSLVRDNGLSRLWWIAHIATKNRPDISVERAIEEFAKLSDLRSSIMERPSISRIPHVFAAIMKCHNRKLKKDPETKFFRRGRTAPYRQWLKLINNLGGSKYFAVMKQKQLESIFWGLLIEVEQSQNESSDT